MALGDCCFTWQRLAELEMLYCRKTIYTRKKMGVIFKPWSHMPITEQTQHKQQKASHQKGERISVIAAAATIPQRYLFSHQ